LVGNPEGKNPLENPGHRWVNNIKLDIGEIRWGVMGWIDLAECRDH
jgi:hypothetical protein